MDLSPGSDSQGERLQSNGGLPRVNKRCVHWDTRHLPEIDELIQYMGFQVALDPVVLS